jgi:hypothetical protein
MNLKVRILTENGTKAQARLEMARNPVCEACLAPGLLRRVDDAYTMKLSRASRVSSSPKADGSPWKGTQRRSIPATCEPAGAWNIAPRDTGDRLGQYSPADVPHWRRWDLRLPPENHRKLVSHCHA